MGSISRRTFLRMTGAVSAGSMTMFAGCQSNVNGSGGGNGTKRLKLGGLMPLSGPFASVGKPIKNGIDLAVDQINNADDDIEVSVTYADTEASANTAVKRARKLIQQNNVNALLGFASSSVANAVSEFVAVQDIVMLNVTSQSESLTGKNCRKQVFTTTTNVSQITKAVSSTVADITGKRPRIAGIIPDYSFGHATWGYFSEAVQTQTNAKIVAEVFPAFGQGDFQSEIQTVLAADPDVIYTSVWAGDLVALIQQGKQYDMFQQVPEFVHGGGSIIDVSRALGKDMVELTAATAYFFQYPDTKRNRQFVKNWWNEYDVIPAGAGQEGYAGTYALKHAIEDANSVTTDNLVSGLEGLEFEAPEGTKRIRKSDHACVEESVWTGHIGPNEDLEDPSGLGIGPIEDLDFYGFTEMLPVPGESVTKKPNCQFKSVKN